ncbi:hypothetical protein [Paraglaciecola aestuariivivens]
MNLVRHGVLALLFVLGPIILLVWIQAFNLNTLSPKLSALVLSPQQAEQQLVQALGLWQNKDYKKAQTLFNHLGEFSWPEPLQKSVSLYQFYANAFVQNNQLKQFKSLISQPKDCKQQLLFVTAHMQSLPQTEYFRAKFAQDSRLRALPICVVQQTWFEPEDLSCAAKTEQGGRISCDLSVLAKNIQHLAFTHLVIFSKQGKANVHNGIMFLDQHDSYDVFIHELAHFSGFIDEYPLSQGLAKRVCKGVEAPNMVFKNTQQNSIDKDYWQSLGLPPQQKLHPARTCDNHPNQAFKASSQLTFMEYHDTAYIPKQYLQAWQQQLLDKPNQPSAHVNFAQAFEKVNDQQASQFWRAKYQAYLNRQSHSNNNL